MYKSRLNFKLDVSMCVWQYIYKNKKLLSRTNVLKTYIRRMALLKYVKLINTWRWKIIEAKEACYR